MMVLAHTRWQESTAEEAAVGVCLRSVCDSNKRSPLFGLIPENRTEPGP